MLQHEGIDPDNAEKVSALLDGELDDAEGIKTLERLRQDQTLRQRWAEYCLIGDALRGEALAQPGFTQRVHKALVAEPTLLAPVKRKSHGWKDVRRFAWAAAAAAVAAVTWMVWTTPNQPTAPDRMVAKSESATVQASYVLPYLNAHLDFAYGVVVEPKVHLSQLTLVSVEDDR